MTLPEQQDAVPQTEAERRQAEEERKAAYKEAAVELGKGIALGLVPFLGQAIDVYDTIESSIVLYNAKKADDKEEAQFDLVLALVGWIPGPGDGVKKSLRLVNKNPDRFAPVLFDLLRFVLQQCRIYTSPEALLQEIFNADKLKTQLQEIRRSIEESSTFQALPEGAQQAVTSTLNLAQASLPLMVLVVEKRIRKWTKKQPNSSAHAGTTGRARGEQPGSRHGAGSQGLSRPDGGGAGDAIHSQAATLALTEISNELVGISGEHIADYICVERFKWGEWSEHDQGSQGRFKVKPDAKTPGKLSKGGSPKSTHKLYKLADGANGTGIDAVWRAEGHNHGKRYAIVEAKATRDEDAPKFMRKLNNTRKPGVASSLGVNAIGDPSELIEPLEDNAGASSKPASAGVKGVKAKGAKQKTSGKPAESPESRSGKTQQVLVQMSREWIAANLVKAVGNALEREVLQSYSRHLFFSPAYHPSGSPKAHMFAKHAGASEDAHANHDAFHYDEKEVKSAVNKRKARLRAKYGNLASLKEEK